MKHNLLLFLLLSFNTLFSFQAEESPPSYSRTLDLYRGSHMSESSVDDMNIQQLVAAVQAFQPSMSESDKNDTYNFGNFRFSSHESGQSSVTQETSTPSVIISVQPSNNSSYRAPQQNSRRSCLPCCSSDSNCCRIRKETIAFTIGEHHQEITTVRPYASKIERACSENSAKLCCCVHPQNNQPVCGNSACGQCCCIICCCPVSTTLVTLSAVPCLISCTTCSILELAYAAVAYPLNMIRGTE
ncbi:hypothetical protein K9K77_02515 [Candidatus Babeliales bacterium]|nr:hypothetical protein [Candidatus Babeliales bacterium]